MNDAILTLDEVCSYLKIHQSTAYRLVKSGKLAGFKVGRDWRFNREQLNQFVAAKEAEWRQAFASHA